MSDKLSMKSGKTLADVDGAEASEETAEKLESTLEPSDQEEDEEEDEGSGGEEED